MTKGAFVTRRKRIKGHDDDDYKCIPRGHASDIRFASAMAVVSVHRLAKIEKRKRGRGGGTNIRRQKIRGEEEEEDDCSFLPPILQPTTAQGRK